MTQLPYASRDILIPLDDPWDAQSWISADDHYGGLRFTQFLPDGYLASLDTAPDQSKVYRKPRRGTPGADLLARVENVVVREISEAKKDVSLQVLLKRIEAIVGDHATGEAMLRALITGESITAIATNPSKPKFRLTPQARDREGHRSYASSFAHELQTHSEQIGRLIGHAPTVGSEREELLRSLIERHVPTRFHVATGFVEGSNRQIDILIYDQVDYAPLFRAGNLVVVPIEAVRALIEVKSMLTSAELQDALTHLEDAIGNHDSGPPVFRGIFAYKGAQTNTLVASFKDHHREPTDIDPDGRPPYSIYDMASAICVLRKTALITGFGRIKVGDGLRSAPAIFELASEAGRDTQAALFFDQLLLHLRHPITGPMVQSNFAQRFAVDVERAAASTVAESENWGPYVIDQGIERVEAQIAAYNHWLTGHAWAEPPRHEDEDPFWDEFVRAGNPGAVSDTT